MRAWHPTVPGVREVLHARMTDHVYPLHAHGDWALMLVDEGAVAYDLGGRPRIADASAVTLLPPGVAHDGRAAPRSAGFRKRVAYLDASWMSEALTGRVVDQPTRADLVVEAHRAHHALALPGEELSAEATLIAVADRVAAGITVPGRRALRDDAIARRFRELLEARLTMASPSPRPVDCWARTPATSLVPSLPPSVSRRTATSPADASTSPDDSCSTGPRRPPSPRWPASTTRPI